MEKSGADSTDSLSAPREQVTSTPSHSGLPDKEGDGVMEPPLEKTVGGLVLFTKDLLAAMTYSARIQTHDLLIIRMVP